MATRHLCRIIAAQALYEWDFMKGKRDVEEVTKNNLMEYGSDIDEPDFAINIAKGVVLHQEMLDEKIKKYATAWAFDELPLMERNILRIAIYELFFQSREQVPEKVAINEAVDLGKALCGENSARFINGVLASVYTEMEKEKSASSQ